MKENIKIMASLIQLKKILLMKKKKFLLNNYKFNCRSCDNSNLKRVVSLGFQPLANNLLKSKKEKYDLYPLEMNYCPNCHNCQLSVAVDPKKCFQIIYTPRQRQILLNYILKKAAENYIKQFKLSSKKSFIIDIGSNDGVALKPFKDLNFKNILGIEPAKKFGQNC